MEKVIIESPFSKNIKKDKAYLQLCIKDCILRNEAPFASHLMYTQALDDTKDDEREKGIEAGFSWRDRATKTVFYIDNGFSRGMIEGLKDAIKKGSKLEVRSLDDICQF